MFGCLLQALVLLIEGIIFAMFGTTIGKALLGVAVITVDGQRPTAGQYLSRQVGVYWYGLGMGVPLITLFTAASQYRRLKSGHQAGYDEGLFNVKARKLGVVRVLSAIFLVLAILLIGIASSMVPSSFKKSASAPSGNERQTTNNSDNATEIVSEGQKPLSAAGKVFKDCADCPEMVVIPAGSFEMGSGNGRSDEAPVHTVRIGKSFAMGKTEVTQKQWRQVIGSDPPKLESKGCDDCPVAPVSLIDIDEFLSKLNQQTGKTYRLPSEAEWEYACRAGGTHTYCGSDAVGAVAWYDMNSGGKKQPVAKKRPNAWGLYDMSGNVMEWVEDCYHDNYIGAPTDGSKWMDKDCINAVVRGGSWFVDLASARAASRNYVPYSLRYEVGAGFRVMRSM
jgi:formylglycine-generating enzyme required for sulfatase activity